MRNNDKALCDNDILRLDILFSFIYESRFLGAKGEAFPHVHIGAGDDLVLAVIWLEDKSEAVK